MSHTTQTQPDAQKNPPQPGTAAGAKAGAAVTHHHTTKRGDKEHAKRHSFGGWLGSFQGYGKQPGA